MQITRLVVCVGGGGTDGGPQGCYTLLNHIHFSGLSRLQLCTVHDLKVLSNYMHYEVLEHKGTD